MNAHEFRESLTLGAPPDGLRSTLAALWWDAKGDWVRAHALVDELESPEGMAVHAYLHRKEGAASNADYCTAAPAAHSVGPPLRPSGKRLYRR
jgi:hypothetical protein